MCVGIYATGHDGLSCGVDQLGAGWRLHTVAVQVLTRWCDVEVGKESRELAFTSDPTAVMMPFSTKTSALNWRSAFTIVPPYGARSQQTLRQMLQCRSAVH